MTSPHQQRDRVGRFDKASHSAPEATLEPRALGQELRKLRTRLEREHAGLMLDLAANGNSFEVRCIVVPEEHRGRGTGNAVMKAVTDFADKNKVDVTLTPSDAYGGDVQRLLTFYQQLGFVPNHGEELVRTPESS